MSRGEGPRSSCERKGELITTVIVWLLLGAIVNVAVAWGCSLRAKMTDVATYAMSTSGAQTIPFDTGVFFRADSAFIRQYDVFGWQFRGRGVRTLRVSHWIGYNVLAEDTGDSLVERECGWPLRALEGRCRELEHLEWGIPLPKEWSRGQSVRWSGRPVAPTFVPLRPIWPGFAINTLLYAALLWLLFAAPFALRRRRRIKRGLCVKCAYPVGESEVCTECGAVVKPPPKAVSA